MNDEQNNKTASQLPLQGAGGYRFIIAGGGTGGHIFPAIAIANALKKAETYAEMMSMSDSAIYEQLISEYGEKFTKEEAQYAVDNLK